MSREKSNSVETQEPKGKAMYSLASLGKALVLFFRLTNEQTSLLFRRKIEGERTIADWQKLLNYLAEFDKHADNSRKVLKIHIWVGVILSFLAFIVLVASEKTDLLDILWRVSLFFILVHLVLYVLLKKVDLSNHLRVFLVPLLKILAQESNEESVLRLKTYFSSAENKYFLSKSIKPPSMSKSKRFWYVFFLTLTFFTIALCAYMVFIDVSNIIYLGFFMIAFFIFLGVSWGIKTSRKYPVVETQIYVYPWLSFSAKMADDTLLSVEMIDTLFVRKVTKKVFTGRKTKLKTKIKKILKRRDKITIGFEKDDYAIAQSKNISTQKT